jgi:Rieske Fe-S protein
MQNRRDFIKKSCTLCVGLMGMGAIVTQLSSCAVLPIFKGEMENDVIAVPLSFFIDKNKMLLVRNPKLEFDILLVKIDNAKFNALLMKCTHQENALTATEKGLFCASHGSAFDLEGNVTKEPALSPLKKFKTEINNSSILINLN